MSKKQFLEKAIASLKLLRKKALSDTERALLLSFPGGGILKECGVFTDSDKPQWLKDGRAELQELLDCHEWASLQNAGMQNAHYTAPGVRQVMWETIAPILRENDRILDPGCGIGGFYLEMPKHLGLKYTGVEKDCVSSAIAKLAHPGANIYHKDFLKWSYPQQFNLVIGNVPFTNGVQSMNLDGEWLRIGLHAQFFVNAIAHLAPGGLLMFLTSISTLDARSPDYIQFREWVHRKCEFLGAVRLPNQGTHDGATEVTTDLIVLRRRKSDVAGTDARWIRVSQSDLTDYNGNAIHLNNWYLDNPQYLIGEPVCGNLRGKNGNPTANFALQPRPNQDVLGDFRVLLNSLLNPKCQEVKKMIGEVWSLESIDDPNFKNLSKFYAPHGFFALWETSEQGEWFVVDEYDANIKLDDDARGKRTFAGDDAYTVAMKAYNWYLSDQVGDYYATYPWVGKRAKAFCIHDKEIVKGIITLVNPDGEGVSHVCIVTPDGEEHTCCDWEFIESNQQLEEQIDMATVIPAEKFKSNSVYAFILRQNPKQSGIEIHFPPDCQMDGDNAQQFVARVISAGFRQANKNPKLYYATYTEVLWQKARSWVQSCRTFDAYELDADEPVEKTPSRRRYGTSATKELAASTPPATPNKLLDAISALLDNKIDPLAENIAACIVDRLKSERRDSQELDKLKAERDALVKDSVGLTQLLEQERQQMKRMQNSYCELENQNKLLSTYCDEAKAQLAISGEALEQKAATIAQLRLECGQLRSQLIEFGLEPESAPSAPTFEDEPVFADESQEEITPTFADESVSQPKFDDEEEGFDLDELDGGK